MFYPMFFKPIYKENVWGGIKLNQLYNRKSPYEYTGENWDVAAHEKGMSIIENGEFEEKTLKEIMEKYPQEILGEELKDMEKFPLLIKLIHAEENLSVQVHPNDRYAMLYENGQLGKCEMWYVLHAKEGAKLVFGIKDGSTKEDFKKAIEKGQVKEYLKEIEVRRGDVLNIPAGRLHAIGAGIILVEVQQNSDLVYRVYDWGRLGLDGKPRELHVEKALDVINFKEDNSHKVQGLSIDLGEAKIKYLIANSYFAVEEIILKGSYVIKGYSKKFIIYTCIEGECTIIYKGEKYLLEMGRSVFMPAILEEWEIEGDVTLLKSYVPNIYEDFITPLKNFGYSDEEINRYVSIEHM
ncbi:class I mannose-6-phosphate isomerase [Clostridium malenominatum]|uniref:Phosphohexomutase n=1 Tax=Clostridium malenominatum TaxID=1539 RepID=A0ABP3U8I8_9CLOT